MKTKIIYEDAHILVCHKPAGLATQTARIGQADVESELKNYIKSPYLGIVHRLDQPVEGLLVFARTKEAAAKLTAQLSQGTLNKQYYGITCGKLSSDKDELVDYLLKDKASNTAKVMTGVSPIPKEAKKAVLQYKKIGEVSTPEQLSLLDIHIDTGRFHQIRAQLAHAGLALLGDSKYGDEASVKISRQLGITNVALCAYQLELQHPITNKKLSFQIKPEGKSFQILTEFFAENTPY